MKLYHGTNLQGFLKIMECGYIQSPHSEIINNKPELITFWATSFNQSFLHGIYIFEIEVDDFELFDLFIDMNDETNEEDYATIHPVSVSEKIDKEEEDGLKVYKIYIPNIDYDIDSKIEECYPDYL
jgi:tagatose-1,6-bisphosphate aldolase